MIPARTGLSSMLALGLVAGSSGAVAAQDGAPTEFTAEWGFTSMGCCVEVEPASDPRFAGEMSATVTMHQTVSADRPGLWSRTFRVSGDDGSWQGRPHTHVQFPDGTASGVTQTFVGEGAYEGLYVVAETTTTSGAGGGVVLHGFIFEGEPPF